MNPQTLFAQQAAHFLGTTDALLAAVAIAILGLVLAAGYALFLAIERFRGLNNIDADQRARESMLLAAERARLQTPDADATAAVRAYADERGW